MATFTEKIKRQIAPSDKYEVNVLPEAGKDMARLGLTDEYYKPTLLEKVWWPIQKKLEAIKDFPDEVRFFIQRGRRGYSTKDVWDFHQYLEEVISGGLKELVTHKSMYSSHPCGYKEIKSHKDWKRTVLKMARDIEEGSKYLDLSEDWTEKQREKKLKQFEEGMKALNKYWFSLWD